MHFIVHLKKTSHLHSFNPLIRLNKNFFKTKFGDDLTKLGVPRRSQLAIYSHFHEESEYEVQNIQILQENINKSISSFQNKYMLTRSGCYIALRGLGFGQNLKEILPTSLPELPIQLRHLISFRETRK